MSAAEEVGPPTTPSMRGPAVAERVPSVELRRPSDLPEWTQPISASAPLIRVAQWAQRVAVDPAEAARAAGITATHLALLTMIGQFQGRHEDAPVGITRLAKTTFMNERTARDALDDLVKYGWIAGKGARGVQSRFVLTLENGRPIESRKVTSARARWSKPAIPSAGIPSDVTQVESAIPSDSNRVSPPIEPGIPSVQTGDSLRQKDQEEITKEITGKTIAGVPAPAHTCEAPTVSSPQANLFGEPVQQGKPSRAKAAPKPPKPPKEPKPKREPPPKPPPSPVTLLRDCWFAQWAEAKMPGVGPWDAQAATAAKAYLDIPGATLDTAKEAMIGMLRTHAGEWHRTEEHGRYATVHAALMGKHTVPFAAAGKRWLAEQDAATRPKREIPPPVPIPEMFLALARADAEAGRVHPLVQHFENLRKSKET